MLTLTSVPGSHRVGDAYAGALQEHEDAETMYHGVAALGCPQDELPCHAVRTWARVEHSENPVAERTLAAGH